jgi:myosin-1
MENLRVRRAGYCNRQVYEVFVARYKMLSAKTWPVWRKDMKEGATILIDTLRLQKAVAFGKTKIFIKEPSTLYAPPYRVWWI